MKKVSGYISVRALGCYEFEYFVDDNVTDEEIEELVNRRIEMSMDYTVEEGYEAVQEVVYRKKNEV